ncbi:MAG: hypothetical protein IGS03_04735 [Candidatus Sericytochromatia bacterium]|nr:hypothetical protein [Candidatus Sericytochromatia bacterium]
MAFPQLFSLGHHLCVKTLAFCLPTPQQQPGIALGIKNINRFPAASLSWFSHSVLRLFTLAIAVNDKLHAHQLNTSQNAHSKTIAAGAGVSLPLF